MAPLLQTKRGCSSLVYSRKKARSHGFSSLTKGTRSKSAFDVRPFPELHGMIYRVGSRAMTEPLTFRTFGEQDADKLRVVIFANLGRLPFRNNLVGPVKAFSRHATTLVIDPLDYPGVKPTGGLAPLPVPPEALAKASTFGPHCVICLGGGLFVPEEAKTLFSGNVIFVGIALSDPQALETSLKIAPHFQLFYTQDPQTVSEYRASGIYARRLDLAVDPGEFRPLPVEKQWDVVFVGKWTPYRNKLLASLAEQLKVMIFTHAGETRWDTPAEPPLNDPESLCYAFNRARVALDVALVEDGDPRFQGTVRITPRTFMAAACAVPVLINAGPSISDYFRPCLEIATFQSVEESTSVARWLATDTNANQSMGTLARQRVLEAHTWDHRARTVLSHVTALLRE